MFANYHSYLSEFARVREKKRRVPEEKCDEAEARSDTPVRRNTIHPPVECAMDSERKNRNARTYFQCEESKAGRTVEEHTQCKPRRKEGKKIDRIDSNKNTPDLRTLVTTHQSERKEQPSPRRRKNLTLSSDRRGLQTVKEDKLLCSLIRTAHEIHYR